MARTELERNVQPSLLDRLTDEEPDRSVDLPVRRDESLHRFRQAVQRDIEHLLNTRRTTIPVDGRFPEVLDSVHGYGVPDTTGLAPGTMEGQRYLTEQIRETLVRFEPRLEQVVVRLTESSQVRTPQVRFAIEATLRVDPTPERIVFDSVYEVARNLIALKESS